MTTKQKKCSKCKESKPANEFGLNQHATDGYQSWCKPCDAAHKREKRFNAPMKAQHEYQKQLRKNERHRKFAEEKGLTKECRMCNEILVANKENFYTGNGKLGFGSYCKVCDKKKRQERRNKRKAPTNPAEDWEKRERRRNYPQPPRRDSQ